MHLVSDFDGVWTDPRPEANAIRALMIERLAEAAAVTVERVEAAFLAVEREFDDNPFEYGWLFDNTITAFAGEDMYGRNHAVAAALWSGKPEVEDGALLREAVAKAAGSGDALADSCFKDARAAYRRSHSMSLLPDAAATVESLRSIGLKVTIVSNSKIDHIVDLFEAAKIDLTGIDVIGGARKFHLGRVEELPEHWAWNGGKISLQRPHYYELLDRLHPDAVIGDVLSLDLALPLHMRGSREDWKRFRAGLIQMPYTPKWAIGDASAASSIGLDILPSLASVPDWLNEI